MRGDALARGARSATFQPAKVSQARWDAIWAEEPKEETPESKNEEMRLRAVGIPSVHGGEDVNR